MASLGGQDREYVRRAWNKLAFRNNDVYRDRELLPREGASVDRLIVDFEAALGLATIGAPGVRAMIDRLVFLADNESIRDHDVIIHFTTQPFGTVLTRARAEFVDEEGLYPQPPQVAADSMEAAFAAVGEALMQWAMKEGLEALKALIVRWMTQVETYGVSFGDIRVNRQSQLGLWVGHVDDQANIFLNGDPVGSADLQFPKGASYYLQPRLRAGRNLLIIELRNSGRGRWSMAGRFFYGQQPQPVFGGSQDDGPFERTRIFYINIWAE